MTRLPFLAWAVFLGLAALGLDRGLWLDEYGALAFAHSKSSFLKLVQSYNHPPLYYWLLSLWSHLGTSEPFLRSLSLLFGLITITFVWAAVRRLQPDAAQISALAVALHPTLLWHHQEIRPYALLFASTAFCLFCTVRYRQVQSPRNAWWLVSAILLTLASHTVAILLVPLWLLGAGRADKRIWVAVGLVCLGVFWGLVWPNLFRGDWWYPPPSIPLVSRIFQGQMGVTGWPWSLSVCAFLMAVLWGGHNSNGRRLVGAYLWIWLVSFLVSLVLIPMMLPRSMAFGLLFLLPAACLSLMTLAPRWKIPARLLAFGVAVLWGVEWVDRGIAPREAFKEVFVELRKNAESRDLIVLSPYTLRGVRVGTFYTDFNPRHYHYFSYGPLWELPARLAIFERELAVRALPMQGEFHVYVVSRKGPARWLRQYLDGLLGSADRHWNRGHLHVWRFGLDRTAQEKLLKRWEGQRWLANWTEFYRSNPQMPWPPPRKNLLRGEQFDE